jgi:hypothetical protein
MSFLVRELLNPQTCARTRLPAASWPSGSGCYPNDWIPEMGHYDLDDDPSGSECHLVGFDVHLQAEANQSERQGQARQRIPTSYRGVDAGK